MADVEFRKLEKAFGKVRAVAGVDLHVADGELLVCVGPSGCGKSTLLRLVAGLEEPSAGDLLIGGRSVRGVPPQERNVAMVFQDYALYPHMTVRQNLEFPLKMRRLPKEDMERQVRWVVEHLQMDGLLERLPKQLSGGQRQRVAMGRALVRNPAVSLLDEPLSNLDAKLRVQVRAEIADLQTSLRTTMIYVTHDQVEAMTLGQRVAVFNQGSLQQVDTPSRLYERPANAFVAGFIGNPPMNLLPATPIEAHGRLCLQVGDHCLPVPENCGDLRHCAWVGVRPESLHLSPHHADCGLSGHIDNVEYLGHETLLYINLWGRPPMRLVARIQGMESRVRGDRIHLQADRSAIHLFDQDGQAIPSPLP